MIFAHDWFLLLYMYKLYSWTNSSGKLLNFYVLGWSSRTNSQSVSHLKTLRRHIAYAYTFIHGAIIKTVTEWPQHQHQRATWLTPQSQTQMKTDLNANSIIYRHTMLGRDLNPVWIRTWCIVLLNPRTITIVGRIRSGSVFLRYRYYYTLG